MAMLLQNLEFSMDNPEYQLQYKQTLTVKPKGFYIRAKIRNGMNATELGHRLSGGGSAVRANGAAKGAASHAKRDKPQREGKPLSIYYGSNSGTCEALAQRLAADAPLHGYSAAAVSPLDAAAKEKLPQDHPVAIITASYEGLPPDNATEFYAWTQTLKGNELEKVSYAVFGCGHHDWAQTFHRIPRSIDKTLEARGASRLCAMGLTDAAKGQMFTDFEQWEDEVFWPALETRYGAAAGGVSGDGEAGFASSLSVQFSTPRSSVLRQDVQEAVVVDAKALTAPSVPNEKRHLEVRLPEGVTYRPGDYLAVLPINALERVGRVMRRFHIAWDAHITIEAEGQTNLPTGMPVPVYDILASYVELAQPATKRVRSHPFFFSFPFITNKNRVS
jgi:cytochrome P450/NADPH-cytochrome P450 reductase